jgi:hypothetical protein
MRDPNFIDEQRNADLLDTMADVAYQQEQAMREAFEEHQEQWMMRELNLNLFEQETYDDQA